ncbi:extracellular solute-binding protein family 1 [Ignisphaera aggregans DSM 17230]|uniref:Extracellular solute-binding protein family 1 n=1 Tax=Ignisphaera aggregans (strain DSM 17230 / JCM 13409 / AQ1.S1) TaxID=583356 RepID=E0SSX1_IGNAA|nr:extracellular solute-binding protein family 1 [Ignisphaera aggregans DSM 17230]
MGLISKAISRTASIAIIAIVIIAILGVAIYYISQQGPTPTPTQTAPSPTTQISTPSPTATTTPTTTPTTSPTSSPTTIPSPTTSTTSPSPTPTTTTITISGVTLRVTPEFADFVERAKRGEVSVTIYFGHSLAPEERPTFEEVINMFMQQFPGVNVKIIAYGGMGDMQSAVVAAGALPPDQREALIGNAPDVFTWAHDWIGWMADAGYIVALEDIIGYEAIVDLQRQDIFVPAALSAVRYGGKTYGLPYAGEAIALFINTQLVSNIPKTFNELRSLMEQFYNPSAKTYGISGQIAGIYHLNPWATAFNGYWYDESSKRLGVNSSEVKEAMKFFISNVLRYMDVTDLGHDYQRRLFGEGKAPIYISGPCDVSYAKSTLGINNFTVIPFPEIDGRSPKPWSGFRNMYISVMAMAGGSERKYAAALLVLYLTLNDDVLLKLVKGNGYVPVKLSVADYINTHMDEDPIFKVVYGFFEQVMSSVPMPKDKNMQVVWGVDQYIQSILQVYTTTLSNTGSIDEAVKAALGVVDQYLDEAYAAVAPKIQS